MADMSDMEIEQWKVRRLIRQLDATRGSGTSAITLTIQAGRDINLTTKMLAQELATAESIKSRTNRLSVLSAITSTQQRLRRYSRTPLNGLIVYCGEMSIENGKTKKVTIDFEPFKPMTTSKYICDNRFHTEILEHLLESDDKFGFLIMDGRGSLFGLVQGNHREVLHKFQVDLPPKHGRGGQSALRFARLRLEKRHNYMRKVGELATHFFIDGDRPNIKGLIVAGSAEFKHDLTTSRDLFDPRLAAILLPPLLDVSYGGEMGFNQAIDLAAETLSNVKIVQEKRLISKFLDEVSRDTGRFCFGVQDTIQGLDLGAVETILVWENLPLKRLVLQNPQTGEEKVHFVAPEHELDEKLYRCHGTGESDGDPSYAHCLPCGMEFKVPDPPKGRCTVCEQPVQDGRLPSRSVELQLVVSENFVDWIVENYKSFGTTLEFISDRSQEGNQFCKGFGGIGGILRYPVEFEIFDDSACNVSDSDDDFM